MGVFKGSVGVVVGLVEGRGVSMGSVRAAGGLNGFL